MILIAPGSSKEQTWKRWPFFLDLSKRIRCYAIGLDEEIRHYDHKIRTKNFIRLVEIIRFRSRLVVCNDSAIGHICDYYHLPVIVIFGPTSHYRSALISKNTKILRLNYECQPCFEYKNPAECDHKNCLYDIKPSMVIHEIQNTFGIQI